MKLQKLNIRGRIMNIAKWRYKLEIFKVKKFLCVMMLFVLAARVAYSENVGQETKTINNMPAYFTIGTNLLYWAALAPNVTAEYYFPDSGSSSNLVVISFLFRRFSSSSFLIL